MVHGAWSCKNTASEVANRLSRRNQTKVIQRSFSERKFRCSVNRVCKMVTGTCPVRTGGRDRRRFRRVFAVLDLVAFRFLLGLGVHAKLLLFIDSCRRRIEGIVNFRPKPVCGGGARTWRFRTNSLRRVACGCHFWFRQTKSMVVFHDTLTSPQAVAVNADARHPPWLNDL